MVSFKDKNEWVLILGGSSGLGYATALKLARHGLNICIVHRDRRASLPEIKGRFNAIKELGVQLLTFNEDAFNEDKIDLIIKVLTTVLGEKGRIKGLVHSVAKGNLKPMVDKDSPVLTHRDFQLTIDAMALSLYVWTQALFSARLFAKDARIISFTSEGNRRAWPNYAAVSAAKVALEAITRNIAVEFAPYGISANCLQAGITDTASLRAIPGSEQLLCYGLQRNPHRRLTLPEDVANVVFLMMQPEAAWINGCIIPVDGGAHIR
ncbi:SDR family oxidoreductase [Flavobacteriaceae bacterium F08102]|nr:SDR family oxidoreductase [Flavobacteriaceae bacterium F08102]